MQYLPKGTCFSAESLQWPVKEFKQYFADFKLYIYVIHFAQFAIPCNIALLLTDGNRTTSSASTDFI